MAQEKILIIEDEPSLTEVLSYNLQREGYEVVIVHEGREGLRKAQTLLPSLLILDLMLPGLDGLEICRELRASSQTAHIPILMLTAKAEETDQIVGFAVGADDYVTKPFSVKVLLQRVKALLRRAESPEPVTTDVIETHGIRLDKRSHQVTLDGQALPLTLTEFRLLETLMKQPGRAFTRHDLMDAAIGDAIVLERTIDVHIKSVRRKLGTAGQHVETVRGVGYRFRENSAEPSPSE
jgi:two-component system phosphate regulon response regulator PhoB